MSGRINPGGPMLRPRPAGTVRINPGGPMKRARPARPAPRINPGGPMLRAGHAKKARKVRGVTPADVQCCAAEALAASLRLAGGTVSDADVLALYRHTADSPDAGASILATLEAAAEYGLGGWRPVVFGPALQCGGQGQLGPLQGLLEEGAQVGNVRCQGVVDLELAAVGAPHGLILGVDLPGPHAVTVGPDGAWWSWGEPYDPAGWADAVVEEAWAVSWDG